MKIKKLGLSALYLGMAFTVLLTGQQCAEVDLGYYEEVNLASANGESSLSSQDDYLLHRRFIFLVDMSYSMVSGPCPQDIGEPNMNPGGFSGPYIPYDPNKGVGNKNDHRMDGIDCVIDPSLELARSSIDLNIIPDLQSNPPVFYKTHLGSDHSKLRLKILRKWITDSIKNNPSELTKQTKILIIPISGGQSQLYLEENFRAITGQQDLVQFINIDSDRIMPLIDWMEKEHDKNLQDGQSLDFFRYKDRTMGTSSPGSYLNRLYEFLQKDMRAQNKKGILPVTEYQMIHLTDGNNTPLESHFKEVLETHPVCSACAQAPEKCSEISTMCGSLSARLSEVWGYSKDNKLENLDFYFGLFQALPFYFGAGYLQLDFVHLNQSLYKAMYPDSLPYFEQLKPFFEKRKAKISIWSANSENPPFKLNGDTTQVTSLKITDFFILNMNYRLNFEGKMSLDSDGDGAFDQEEASFGLDPKNPRSNGYILDGFIVSDTFRERANYLAKSGSCDRILDSDGDSFNECEESLLGTSSFDFDTDGDTIPDSYEWLYGLNPNIPDDRLDSNGDGHTNKAAFTVGVPPLFNLDKINPSYRSNYEVNFMGKQQVVDPQFGPVIKDVFEVLVKAVPVAEGLPSTLSSELSASRISSDPAARAINNIPYEQQLFSKIEKPYHNTLTTLARIIDATNPKKVYWKIYKTSIPISGVYSNSNLNLENLTLIRARDRNE